ncbi:hypothetical protein B0H12DRAFT_1020251, partial [Mycena haematopus]
MEAPSAAAFWKQVKRLSDPAPIPASVSANDLKNVFESRLNPPKIMPQSFDAAEHTMNNLLADMIPDSTEDTTPEGFFSAPWTEAHMEAIKVHIKTHSLDSGSGEDAVLYAEILEIPNEDLLLLCNECLASIPDSYRIIALESCVLKVLMLLIHLRITEWADARGHIPNYQNGFRAGYRTNNNPFILRCVKEWARANGLTVYVAAVDATNAFPSTDHPTLWLKLLRMGMGGKIFD